MPVIITFDQEGGGSNDLNRIHSMFARFGWQNLGGSTFRYPRLERESEPEDWLNHVIPALMLLRSYFTSTGRPLKRFTIDTQASAAFAADVRPKARPRNTADILFESPRPEFGEKKLLQWLNEISFPYPGTER